MSTSRPGSNGKASTEAKRRPGRGGGEEGEEGDPGGLSIIMALAKFGSWSQCNMSFMHFAGLDMHIAANH